MYIMNNKLSFYGKIRQHMQSFYMSKFIIVLITNVYYSTTSFTHMTFRITTCSNIFPYIIMLNAGHRTGMRTNNPSVA